jgi:hypothetical protein
MSRIICGNCKSIHASVDEVRACYAIEAPAEVVRPAPEALHFVGDGYYTIVFDEATDDRITLRVRPHWEEDRAQRGEKVVDYLRGADNTKDYTGFAFLTPHGKNGMWSVWSKFRSTSQASRLERALEVLHRAPEAAGLEYAMRSDNCYRCGRVLTVPASLCRGLGPVCADKY